MNRPLPTELKAAYTMVYDGGSLEHVFAFPQAIQNCMEMLSVGGHFLGISPANNYAGHGFYQFSPELYFRIFTRDNGFQLEKLVVFPRDGRRWYAVSDPAIVGRRVTLTNSQPTLMAVLAKKINAAPAFARLPQQSDYSAKWRDASALSVPHKRHSTLRSGLRRVVSAMKQTWRRGYSPKFYFRDRSGEGSHSGRTAAE
jgi:hypothetical protein